MLSPLSSTVLFYQQQFWFLKFKFPFGVLFTFLLPLLSSMQSELLGLLHSPSYILGTKFHSFYNCIKFFLLYLLNSLLILSKFVQSYRSLHLLIFWILFENVMSLHRTKATFIGLFEAGRVNEWVVTEKLGDALKTKAVAKAPRKPRVRIGERYSSFAFQS